MDDLILYPIVLLLAVAALLMGWKTKYRYAVIVVFSSAVLAVVASSLPAGSEWAITGNACNGWCYAKMGMSGFPLVVYRPDGVNSVSFFFSPVAFLINWVLFMCIVHTGVSLVRYFRQQRQKSA